MEVEFWKTELVPERLVEETLPKLAFQRLVGVPSVLAKSVVGLRSEETVPFKTSVPETERELTILKAAVEVPPAKTMALVVVLPELVTVWKSGEAPEGQLVPLARHTDEPFT